MSNYELAVRLWQQRHIQNDAELAEALNGHSISFAYHSGKIENENVTYHDTREIFEHDGVTSYTGDLRTLFEIRNAKDANELFLTAFNEKRAVDEALVKEFQFKLTNNTYDTRCYRLGERPGEYKKHDYVTGREEVGASPEDVEDEMRELLSEIQDVTDEKILTAAACFHAKFENIHPFADGNGRTGRLLMNYLLVLHHHPPVVIHEEDRREYFNALEAWDTAQELVPLIEFLKCQSTKRKVSDVKRVEIERRLSESEYIRLLMNADTTRRQIRKDRYCLTYENQYFEIDVYPFWNDKAIAEIELSDENADIKFPKQIKVIKEVTDDESYKKRLIGENIGGF